jgi:hypothetical protein
MGRHGHHSRQVARLPRSWRPCRRCRPCRSGRHVAHVVTVVHFAAVAMVTPRSSTAALCYYLIIQSVPQINHNTSPLRRYLLTLFKEIIATKMGVFWIVAPCNLVELYQRFRGLCCLHQLVPDYTALQPRRQPSSYSPP